MADEELQTPASPPLPKKGSYNIDFDTLDDSVNPFESKVKLGSSPPINSGMPAPSFNEDPDLVDPFKPTTKCASSPPGSPKVKLNNNNNNQNGESRSPPSSLDVFESSGDGSPSTGMMDDNFSADAQTTPVTPKKKKVIKKPKVQSKLRPPKNVKPPQENAEDVQLSMPGLDESISDRISDSVDDGLPALPATEQTSEEKLESSGPKAKTKGKNSAGFPKKAPVNAAEDDVPYDAAPDAMASSSEIDQHFVDHDDLEETEHINEGFAPTAGAFDGTNEWSGPQKLSDGVDGGALETTDRSLLEKFDPLEEERLAKPPVSQEKHKDRKNSNEDLPVVNSAQLGKAANTSNTKHPAARALESVQADTSSKVSDKNESSSEDSQFYDAYEYPPVATSKTKLGQKNSTSMERSLNHEEGGDNKGTVVQLVQVLRYSQSDWNKMKQEMELNFQATLLNKERDWSLMLAERDKKISALEEVNRKVKNTNEDMRMVVAEFEKTISQLQAEKEKSKSDSQRAAQALESERDQAVEDLQSVEAAFSDLHRRYEKSKSIIEGFKRNEEQLKMCVEDLQTKLKKSDSKLQSLRSQAEEKLDKANEDIEKIKKSTKADIVRLEAALKKAELRISSLEESLQRKEKENQELTAICDELIAKVGS